MRSHLLIASIFLACSSFLNDGYSVCRNSNSKKVIGKNIFDFTVHRLSGERVIISWHTEGESQQVIYEVQRGHEKRGAFTSIDTVAPKSKGNSTADYSFVDVNGFADSSYYRLKKTNADSVIFYSITRGVEGINKAR